MKLESSNAVNTEENGRTSNCQLTDIRGCARFAGKSS